MYAQTNTGTSLVVGVADRAAEKIATRIRRVAGNAPIAKCFHTLSLKRAPQSGIVL